MMLGTEAAAIEPSGNPYVSVPLMLGLVAVAFYWVVLALVDFRDLRTLWATGAVLFAILALVMWFVRYRWPNR
jgi:Na+/melibiose symporter-like transporter